jgi:hypothetical protein
MSIIASYDWESDTFTHHGDNGARQAWREAVAAIADKAKAKLPECNSRVDKAVALVLNGDVELLPDGTAKVASQSNGSKQYVVCNGTCECKDFAKAPHGFCKHRLGAAIARRAQELTRAKLDTPATGQAEPPSQPPSAQPAAPTAPLPEAPVSITLKATLHGHEVMVTLRGVDFASVKAQVEQASEWLKVQAPAQSPTQGAGQPEGWCSKHGIQMKLNHKDGRSWWSHKTADGWCKGKLCRESGK